MLPLDVEHIHLVAGRATEVKEAWEAMLRGLSLSLLRGAIGGMARVPRVSRTLHAQPPIPFNSIQTIERDPFHSQPRKRVWTQPAVWQQLTSEVSSALSPSQLSK